MDEIGIVADELSAACSLVSRDQLDSLAREISSAHHIFVSGFGRSGLMIRAFENRLMHLGLSTSSVGEICSPRSSSSDLLVIASGSGETASAVELATAARAKLLRVALVTASPTSTIASMSDVVLSVTAPSKQGGSASKQPMASLFEQMSLVVYDALVLKLMRITGQVANDLAARHADLE